MNPYYQINEEPKRRRTGVIVAAVVAVIAALVLLLVWLTGPSMTKRPTPGGWESAPGSEVGESEGSADSENSGDTEAAADSEAPVDSAPGWEPEETEGGLRPGPEIDVDISELKLAVVYYADETVRGWRDEVAAALRVIEESMSTIIRRYDVRVGLFDFECDGQVEIVLLYTELKMKMLYVDVFDLAGVNRGHWAFDPDTSVELYHRASMGETYPCMPMISTTLLETDRLMEETYTLQVPPFGMTRVYGFCDAPEGVTYYTGDEELSYEEWLTYIRQYGVIQPTLSDTEMDVLFRWETGADTAEIAGELTRTTQKFVMPVGEWLSDMLAPDRT